MKTRAMNLERVGKVVWEGLYEEKEGRNHVDILNFKIEKSSLHKLWNKITYSQVWYTYFKLFVKGFLQTAPKNNSYFYYSWLPTKT